MKTTPKITYGDCKRIAEALGFSVVDGLAFTIGGGKLCNGDAAPDWIAKMNGHPVEGIAREAMERKAVERQGRYAWKLTKIKP